MLISNIDFNNDKRSDLLNNILRKTSAGYVFKNFLSQDEISLFRSNGKNIEALSFEPYEGYKCMPRAFNYINEKNQNEYSSECEVVLTSALKGILLKKFQYLFDSFSIQLSFKMVDKNSPFTLSKTTVSYRFLEPQKGNFLLHCGLLFDEYNKSFYDPIRNEIDQTLQLSFFVMIQKPDSDCDIKVFDAKWDDYKNIEEHKYFIDINGRKTSIYDFEYQDVNMSEGDLLVFDGGNYWHLVPAFNGVKSRITMGGFISKFLNSNQLSIWA